MAVCYVQVKVVDMLVDHLACYPAVADADEQRQLEHFIALASKGQRIAIVFMVVRSGARALVPNEDSAPMFTRLLRRAIAVGVEVYAYRCQSSAEGLILDESLPVFGSREAVTLDW